MSARCPRCGADMDGPTLGRLPQSGETHLPANVWTCPKCPEPTVCTLATGAPYAVDPEYLAALAKEHEDEARRGAPEQTVAPAAGVP